MKNKNIILAVLIPCFLVIVSCASLRENKNLKIPVHLVREKLNRASILVLNFQEPPYAEGSGTYLAQLFHLELLNTKKFQVASLITNSTWNRIADMEETRLLNAWEEGKSKKFDYILVGEILEYYYGGINPTRVKFKIRIIEVNTRATIFLAEYAKQSDASDLTYPMNTQLSKKAIEPKQLAEEMVKEVIKKL